MIPTRRLRRPELRFALVMLAMLAVLTGLTLSALPGRLDAAACRMDLSEMGSRGCGL